MDLLNIILVYGLYFKYRNPRTFPVYGFAHDCRRTLVRAEYGYPKGSPNTNIKEEIRHYSFQYNARLSLHPKT
jgi:hypothetical protein